LIGSLVDTVNIDNGTRARIKN